MLASVSMPTHRPWPAPVFALTLVIATALLVAACGGAPSPSPSGPAAAAPGTYTTAAFTPTVTYTLPAGWSIGEDTPTFAALRPAGSTVTGIHFFRDPVAASQMTTCPDAAEPGVGASAKELADWIAARPGLVASPPEAIELGGLAGYLVDIGIRDGWSASCPFADGLPTVPLFVRPGEGFRWVVAGSERLRLYVLEVPGDGVVVVDIDAFDGRLIDDLLESAVPIVSSLRFAVP